MKQKRVLEDFIYLHMNINNKRTHLTTHLFIKILFSLEKRKFAQTVYGGKLYLTDSLWIALMRS